MRLATLASLLRGDLLSALAVLRPTREAQRIAFLAGAGAAGVLGSSSRRPGSTSG